MLKLRLILLAGFLFSQGAFCNSWQLLQFHQLKLKLKLKEMLPFPDPAPIDCQVAYTRLHIRAKSSYDGLVSARILELGRRKAAGEDIQDYEVVPEWALEHAS